jgi:hypothetical protein
VGIWPSGRQESAEALFSPVGGYPHQFDDEQEEARSGPFQRRSILAVIIGITARRYKVTQPPCAASIQRNVPVRVARMEIFLWRLYGEVAGEVCKHERKGYFHVAAIPTTG